MPVPIDSGFRRGTGIVKALALGATAAGAGRPVFVGPRRVRSAGRRAGTGNPRRETHAVMRQMGAPTIKDLTPSMVRRA
jgi:isopentenyl diphosphate isomerase/L-lactate dehydrogenase-like FMN-dependent dehydrogenase